MSILPAPNLIGLPARYDKWRHLQDEAVLDIASCPERFVMAVQPTGCLTGDTEIMTNRAGASRHQTLAQILRGQIAYAGRRKPGVVALTRSFTGERIRLHAFERVVVTGTRDTWELRVQGHKPLRGTPDHQILTPKGFVALCQLGKGHIVLCDDPQARGTEQKKRKPEYLQTQGLIFHPFAGRSGSYRVRGTYAEGRLYRVPYHRLVAEADLNGISVNELIEICRYVSEAAKGLRFLDPEEFAVHHRDGNHRNNERENLQVLTHEAHQALHGHLDGYQHFGQGVPQEHRVTECFATGKAELVYDLLACEPYANFAANGIIVHNSGKTLTYTALAVLMKTRAAILTRTKPLQTQIQQDFAEIGMAEIRGANSYPCTALKPGGELHQQFGKGHLNAYCDHGPCRVGVPCGLRESGCSYYDAVRLAKDRRLVNTNYAYWMSQHDYSKGLGQFGLLVLDEAHDAPDALSDHMTMEIERADLGRFGLDIPLGQMEMDQWRDWANHHHHNLNARLEGITAEIKAARDDDEPLPSGIIDEARHLQRLVNQLALIMTVDDTWVIYQKTAHSWTFTPAWPARFAEEKLFLGIKKIVLTSATVRRKTAELLGIDTNDLAVLEYPSTFPKARRPVYQIPTARMRRGMSDRELEMWASKMDNIIRPRLDRKGIIHTVSYARSEYIYRHSDYAQHMIIHSSMGTRQAIERFKASQPPAILVSPSLSTGYDFPYQECEYIIVSKIPFATTTDPVLKARQEQDEEYGLYLAMQNLVQMAGRGMRSADDQCEILIVDDMIGWLVKKYRHLSPAWFLDALQRVAMIPPPPPKLQRRTHRGVGNL
jgi:ATP-dependent DNA helicase DinG